MADFTKKAMVDAFVRILKGKPFEKITISDITSECGVSRMTFYYHFEDIYDMLHYDTVSCLCRANYVQHRDTKYPDG